MPEGEGARVSAAGLSLSLAEELWFGDFPDDAAEQAAAESLVAMAAKILGLRPFPAEVQQILAMSRDPLCDLGALARRIEADPAFAARTLRLVNSAALATRTACTSIQQAVMRAGLRTIGEMAVAAAMMEIFAVDDRALALREHAMLVAGAGRHLAVKLGIPSDDVYTCGLLHDMGKQLLLQDADEDVDYEAILDGSSGVDEGHLLEREALGYDHAVLGAHVLRAWNIPEPVPTVVAFHHQLQRAVDAGPEISRLVAIVRVADALVHRRMEDLSVLIPSLVATPAGQLLGLKERELARWWMELEAVALESVTADDALAKTPLAERELLCETCGQKGMLCVDCLTSFCAEHGDPRAMVCAACDKSRTVETLEALGEPQGSQKALVIGLAIAAIAALGALAIYALR